MPGILKKIGKPLKTLNKRKRQPVNPLRRVRREPKIDPGKVFDEAYRFAVKLQQKYLIHQE